MSVRHTLTYKVNNCFAYTITSSLGGSKLDTYATVQGVSGGREGSGQHRWPEILTLFRLSVMGVSNKMSSFADKKYCYFYVLFHLYLLAVPYLEEKNN